LSVAPAIAVCLPAVYKKTSYKLPPTYVPAIYSASMLIVQSQCGKCAWW